MASDMLTPETRNGSKPRILAVDDDPSLGAALKHVLGNEFDVQPVQSPRTALEVLYHQPFDGVLLDMHMPELNGIELLKVIRRNQPELPVVMLTAASDPKTIVSAIKAGANDYVVKDTPNTEDEIRFQLHQALEFRRLRDRTKKLEAKIAQQAKKYEIVGLAPSVLKLLSNIAALQGKPASVLIHGESGTGKELVARALNVQEKDGSERPFVAVNCGAIPENLAESELFGHEKGAFTGAMQRQVGKFVLADGGDIFLDEIGDLPLPLQTKLLRVIQERVVMPVGGIKPIPINVRIIAASHKDLKEEVRQGRFREDLYYRLNVVGLSVPPLRERREDIPLLVAHFLKEFGASHLQLTKDALDAVCRHPWPGNIRALRNSLERAWIFTNSDGRAFIRREDLSFIDTALSRELDPRVPPEFLVRDGEELSPSHFRAFQEWAEKLYLEYAYKAVHENKSRLADKLDLSRDSVHRKFRTLGIDQPNPDGVET